MALKQERKKAAADYIATIAKNLKQIELILKDDARDDKNLLFVVDEGLLKSKKWLLRRN